VNCYLRVGLLPYYQWRSRGILRWVRADCPSGSGVLLQRYEVEYEALPLILPVTASLAGNVGCIFASRLSTQFHSKRDTETETSIRSRENLIVMGTLFAISVPIHLAFLGFINLLGTFKFSMLFLFAYLLMGALSVSSTIAIMLTIRLQ